jgi:hypothetical protein
MLRELKNGRRMGSSRAERIRRHQIWPARRALLKQRPELTSPEDLATKAARVADRLHRRAQLPVPTMREPQQPPHHIPTPVAPLPAFMTALPASEPAAPDPATSWEQTAWD